MSNFKPFVIAIRKRFEEMAAGPLFEVAIDRDVIWETYLNSFPAGTNLIFRQRAEHDCSCCKAFIRNTGGIVAIQNGALSSIWDVMAVPEPYQTVADAMSAYVKSLAIRDAFLTPFNVHGTAISHEMMGGCVHEWSHFAVDIPHPFVIAKAKLGERRGELRMTRAVLLRGLTELHPDAVATVLDLIQSKAIYRGEEFRHAVIEFYTLQERFSALVDQKDRELLTWTMIASPVARFRNTVIGTLVQDLSDGVDLDRAVRSYEIKVAPANYKRPTALITAAMVKDAMKTIQELGLEAALERRHARLSDVSVNSVLFVDNAVRGHLKGGIEDLLMQEVKPAKFDPKKAEEISVEDFVGGILPKTKQVQLYLDNGLLGNFVSMTAPVHEESASLFRWNNDFAWSYDGNVADSIKDKIKRAGGTVEGVAMRVSLAWFNYDDLDIHCIEPSGNHVFYANKSSVLDVDMNAGGGGNSRQAVENMRWLRAPRDGVYRFFVNNYAKRESVDVGFVIEIESAKGLETLRYEKAVPDRTNQPVANIVVKHGQIERIDVAPGVITGSISQDQWGLKTLAMVRVNSIVLSPNHWDGNAAGNKHWFFILEGCRNPLPARGIYNEFLHPRLEKHRKVFEVLGDKIKCPVTTGQLSGVGFSSTRGDKVTVIAMGSNLNKAYTIVF
jgi:hypothetical protein